MWTTLGSGCMLKALLIGMLLIETGYLLFVSIAGTHQTDPVFGTLGPCTASDEPGQHIVMGFWLAPVVFDCIVASLTIHMVSGSGMTIALCSLYSDIGVYVAKDWAKSRIVNIFVREGLLYFVVGLEYPFCGG
ncbi:hypothetical protein BT96DRAFT_205541 [Gymnopus androsaceus JB14]|uniref:Uncharacterized protein n=1 Tax=Gymnopus androsaceus JB14 TaxID=1447944 RepID=A0A6A4IBR9_9AGAR|nr:hypothetical protein BT96DRAFT_205541 [Gymnopus androsaceus JB14]